MARKKQHEVQNRTKIVKIRLTESERDLIENKSERQGINMSKYIRFLLLNKEIPVRIYDETGDKFCITIGNFTQQIKKIGVNHNQIVRKVQAKHSPEEAKKMLNDIAIAYSEVLKLTGEIFKISQKIQQHYDSKH